jgi:zinc/manganese transport system ATP-binding protein
VIATATPAEQRTTAPAVELENATIRIGGRPILNDVSLTISQGEFVAVLGPNGAGKSTLMRAILGLIPVEGPAGRGGATGVVRVFGTSPREARSRIGYLPQRQGFDRSTRIRGRDLVQLGLDGTRWGIPLPVTPQSRNRRRAERGRVHEVIELVGAGAYADRPIGELSGGEQQRLLIAAALVRGPELLILDEPLDSLDLPNQASVAGLIRRISSAENVSVLLVAHDVNPLLGYLDRVVYLAGGRALAGSVSEVMTAPQLSALYGSPIEVLKTADGRLVVVGQPDAAHHHGGQHDHTGADHAEEIHE